MSFQFSSIFGVPVRYLKAKFPHFKGPQVERVEVKPQEVKPKIEKPDTKETKETKAPTLDYSKWSNIVDSDDEEDPKVVDEDVGVKDLAEGVKAKKEPPIPDYLLGSTGGGGGTNCLTSIVKMLDSEQTQENAHQFLACSFKPFIIAKYCKQSRTCSFGRLY